MKQLQVSQLLSTAFHPQTDGQTERVNRVVEDMLRHYVRADQVDWDRYLPLVEYAINNSYHSSLGPTPFFLNAGQHPRSPIDYVVEFKGGRRPRKPRKGKDTTKEVNATSNGTTPVSQNPSVQAMFENMSTVLLEAKQMLHAAQQRQKAYADRNRREVSFDVGQQVLLSTKNLTLKMIGSAKLMPKYVGPFTIVKQINPVAYKLKLPPSMKIHDVFHASLLKDYREDGSVKPPPPPTLIDDTLEYEVERILCHRERKVGNSVKNEFLVKWLGYAPEHNTWEPEANLANCPEVLTEYWATVKHAEALKKTKTRRRLKAKRQSGSIRHA